MTREEAIEILNIALDEANRKHPEWYYDIIHCASVMGEEAGEAIRAALNYTYEDNLLEDFICEVAQTGAMAIKILMNLPQDHLPNKFKQYNSLTWSNIAKKITGNEEKEEENENHKSKSLEWLHSLDDKSDQISKETCEETKKKINDRWNKTVNGYKIKSDEWSL
jgi:hypothetical protein